jgi:hypothetical protein
MKLFSASFYASNDPVLDNVRLPFPRPLAGILGRTQSGTFVLALGTYIGGSPGIPPVRSPRQIAEIILRVIEAKTALAALSAVEWSPIRKEIEALHGGSGAARKEG